MPVVFRRLLVNTLVTGVTQLVPLVRADVLGVPGDALGRGDGRDRRRVQPSPSAVFGPFFGTYVDRHRKHTAMMLTTRRRRRSASRSRPRCSCSSTATSCFGSRSPWFWVLVAFTLLGSVAGQMRGIALSTCVTLLVPEEPARPRQRHGRHRHRRVVRDHVGVQRPRHRTSRDGLGVLRRARHSRSSRSPTSATITIDEPEPEARRGGRGASGVGRRPRRARGDPRRARAGDAHRCSPRSTTCSVACSWR